MPKSIHSNDFVFNAVIFPDNKTLNNKPLSRSSNMLKSVPPKSYITNHLSDTIFNITYPSFNQDNNIQSRYLT